MHLKIAVGIPTYRRAAVLRETLLDLRRQTRQPDRIIVCHSADEDIAGVPLSDLGAQAIHSEPGSSIQRNVVIDHAGDCDIVVFFDDDFIAAPDYLEVVARVFAARPDIAVITGKVLADGIKGPGLTVEQGRRLVAAAPAAPVEAIARVANGYGCNMAMRMAPLVRHGLRFDEKLPLYGWQEDAELCCRLSPHGITAEVSSARGVHLGVKVGRSSGLRLGYSQVANPIYIANKTRFYTWRRAIAQVGRNFAANVVRSFRPEPFVDRRGRLRGNLLALGDFLIGRMTPERVREL